MEKCAHVQYEAAWEASGISIDEAPMSRHFFTRAPALRSSSFRWSRERKCVGSIVSKPMSEWSTCKKRPPSVPIAAGGQTSGRHSPQPPVFTLSFWAKQAIMPLSNRVYVHKLWSSIRCSTRDLPWLWKHRFHFGLLTVTTPSPLFVFKLRPV